MFNVIDRDLLIQYFGEAGWKLRSLPSDLQNMWFGKGYLITSNFRYYQTDGVFIHPRREMEIFREFPHNLSGLKGVGGVEKMIADWAKEVELEYKLTRL